MKRPHWMTDYTWRWLSSIDPNCVTKVEGAEGLVVETCGMRVGISMATSVQRTIEAMQGQGQGQG